MVALILDYETLFKHIVNLECLKMVLRSGITMFKQNICTVHSMSYFLT